MDFRLSKQQQAWVEEVRAFLDAELGPAEREAVRHGGGEWSGDVIRTFRRRLLERGWLCLMWPEEDGGLGRSLIDNVLLMDELAYAGAPAIDMTAASVAPTIIRSGTPKQRARWLPAIRRGDVEFAIGYSEPDAGSDLASLRTTAVLEGDEWVINGTKIWNTGAEYCTHEWLACRTDPDAPRHRGISVLVVPLDAPGISVQAITTWRGMRTNQVWFDGVRVPAENLVGERDHGWAYVTQALDFERVAIGITGGLRRLLDDLTAWCRETVVDGEVRLARPDVRRRLAELTVDVELARLLNHRAAWLIDTGRPASAEASMTKVFTTELHARASSLALDLMGLHGQLDPYDERAPIAGLAQLMYRAAPYLRFGGGTNEIQRDIVAQRGHGLPR
ncbi:MAG TPA: acyl-CoA dehydrogenase family protein [Acidimicrobiales bacterium]|nr:acyl-CoA dehydrogenase family protein [Acidimicrobiales bacterium]